MVPAAEKPLAQVTEKTSHAVRLLQVFAFTLIVIPGDFVIKSVGADGYPAALVAYLLFIVWFAGTMLGQHRAFASRYPTRITLVLLWIVSLASYALINHGLLTGTQLTAANRWFMQLLVMSAVVIVAAEGLPTLEDVRRVLRALIWGGAVCGVVAALQFRWNLDLTSYLKLPGFTTNSAAAIDATVVARGAQNRVPGTGIDPIEMGVAMSMLLALAIYMMIYDTSRRKWLRVVPVILIAVAVAASVSRSAVIAVAYSLRRPGNFIPADTSAESARHDPDRSRRDSHSRARADPNAGRLLCSRADRPIYNASDKQLSLRTATGERGALAGPRRRYLRACLQRERSR